MLLPFSLSRRVAEQLPPAKRDTTQEFADAETETLNGEATRPTAWSGIRRTVYNLQIPKHSPHPTVPIMRQEWDTEILERKTQTQKEAQGQRDSP